MKEMFFRNLATHLALIRATSPYKNPLLFTHTHIKCLSLAALQLRTSDYALIPQQGSGGGIAERKQTGSVTGAENRPLVAWKKRILGKGVFVETMGL